MRCVTLVRNNTVVFHFGHGKCFIQVEVSELRNANFVPVFLRNNVGGLYTAYLEGPFQLNDEPSILTPNIGPTYSRSATERVTIAVTIPKLTREMFGLNAAHQDSPRAAINHDFASL
jgi:hypothetical protein